MSWFSWLKNPLRRSKKIYVVPSTELHGGLPTELYQVSTKSKFNKQSLQRWYKRIKSKIY